MASTQTIKSLFGLSDDRKEVEFNLSPNKLTPTIRSGGNYQVYTAPTPLTNQLTQLSSALKRAPTLFGQFANIQQKLGQEDAAKIAGVDADEELIRLKEEEPETYFNVIRRRSYQKGLMEKHIRTEMIPNVQSEVYDSANANLYKNDAAYDEQVNNILSSAWDNFTAAVGEDIANTSDGRAVWTELTDRITAEGKLRYNESVEAVALSNDIETIDSRLRAALSPVDAEGNPRDIDVTAIIPTFTKASLNTLMNQHGLSRGEAMSKLRDMSVRQVEILHNQGKHLLASELYTALMTTTSDDGVSPYADSETTLRLSRVKKQIDAEIEKDDEITTQEKNVFVGEMTSAYGYFGGGTLFSSLTNNQKQLILDPIINLDPTFTMEQLEAAMQKGGGGLVAFERILENIRVNGGDRAQTKLKMSQNAINTARINASAIMPPATQVIDSEVRKDLVERFRQEKLLDPDLTLKQFATKYNVIAFDALTTTEAKMQKSSILRGSDTYKKTEQDTLTSLDAMFDPLADEGLVIAGVTAQTIDQIAKDYTKIIQDKLLEMVENDELKPEGFLAARDELIKGATANIKALITASNSEDIRLQEDDVPEMEVAKQKFEQTVKGQKGSNKTIKKPFETLTAQFKTVQTDQVKNRAFGIFPKYEFREVEFTQDDIQNDQNAMLEAITSDKLGMKSKSEYTEALKYSLYLYGLDLTSDPEKTMDLLEATDMDAADVQLFDNAAQVSVFLDDLVEIRKKAQTADELTTEETKTLALGQQLGILTEVTTDLQQFTQRVYQFQTLQNNLILNKSKRLQSR